MFAKILFLKRGTNSKETICTREVWNVFSYVDNKAAFYLFFSYLPDCTMSNLQRYLKLTNELKSLLWTLITAWLPLAKLATSHVLQGNTNKTYRGRGKRLSVSMVKNDNKKVQYSSCTAQNLGAFATS